MVTLSGKFLFQDNSPVANGVLLLTLSQPCTISGTGQIAPLQKKVTLGADGSIPGSTQVYGNDALSPSGTVYVAQLSTSAGQVLASNNWSLTGSSVDVSTLTPTSGGVQYVSPIVSVVVPASEFSDANVNGTVTISKVNQSANLVWAGPSSGAAAAPAFRALVGADLPAPQAAVLGGVNSKAAVSHQFLTSIGTDGSVGQAALAAADIPATVTATLKKGSGSGDYSSASTSYVDVDGTNLSYTVTIPTGSKLIINASGAAQSNTAVATVSISLFDGATVLETSFAGEAAGVPTTWALNWVINGDGLSHTIKLQFKTSAGADSVVIKNSSATLTPTMVFQLVPSN